MRFSCDREIPVKGKHYNVIQIEKHPLIITAGPFLINHSTHLLSL